MKKKMSVRVSTAIITAITIVAQFVAPAQMAYAASPHDSEDTSQSVPGQQSDKVFVCKYSGHPSVGEKAQTVNSVAFKVSGSNDPSQWRWPGTAFNDAQGLSYILAWDTGQQTPSTNACPTLAAVPVNTALVDDPCGIGNASWILPADTTTTHWSINQSGHLIASAKSGYMFINGTLSVDFGVAPETNTAACVSKIPKPTVPIIDLCGPANITYGTVPASAYYTFIRNQDGSITFTANNGFIFDDGSANGVTTYTLPVLHDSGALCQSEPIPAPQHIDPCGIANAYWVMPSDTPTVHWALSGGQLTATTVGVLFTNGQASINFGNAVDSGVMCSVALPQAPTPIDPCGTSNATWGNIPANTASYTWQLSDGHLIATTTTNYLFDNGSSAHDFGLAPDSGDLCPTPVVVNPTCDTPGSITLPAVKDDGFSYHYTVTIGTDVSTYTATALPKTIYVAQGMHVRVTLVRDGLWQTQIFDTSYDFALLGCIQIPVQPTPIDPCGTDNASWTKPEDTATVTWSIENGHLIAHAVGSLFIGDEASHDFGLAPDSNILCAPTPPRINVKCGLYNNDEILLPELSETDHYSWSIDGNDATNTLTVQAIADEGYSFSQDTKTTWEFVDQHTACMMPEIHTTPKMCATDATVSLTYDAERYHYTIRVGDGPAVVLANGTTTLTQVGTYTVNGYEYRYSDRFTDQADEIAFTTTFAVSAPNCSYGRGSVMPPVVTPPTTATELPHTGSDGIAGLIVALIAATSVYGIVFFAQPRRS